MARPNAWLWLAATVVVVAALAWWPGTYAYPAYGYGSGWLMLVIALVCPVMMFFMMRDMGGRRKPGAGTEPETNASREERSSATDGTLKPQS